MCTEEIATMIRIVYWVDCNYDFKCAQRRLQTLLELCSEKIATMVRNVHFGDCNIIKITIAEEFTIRIVHWGDCNNDFKCVLGIL